MFVGKTDAREVVAKILGIVAQYLPDNEQVEVTKVCSTKCNQKHKTQNRLLIKKLFRDSFNKFQTPALLFKLTILLLVPQDILLENY